VGSPEGRDPSYKSGRAQLARRAGVRGCVAQQNKAVIPKDVSWTSPLRSPQLHAGCACRLIICLADRVACSLVVGVWLFLEYAVLGLGLSA
jgi:hypothetical protein